MIAYFQNEPQGIYAHFVNKESRVKRDGHLPLI